MTHPATATVVAANPPTAPAHAHTVRSHARAAQFSTPLTWDSPAALGPRVEWSAGSPRRAFAGPRTELGLSTWSQSVSAGDEFACAQLTGLSLGPFRIQRVVAICASGLTSVQIDGGADGRTFHPGQYLEIDGYSVEVGQVGQSLDGITTVTGLSIACPGGQLLTLAVASAITPT